MRPFHPCVPPLRRVSCPASRRVRLAHPALARRSGRAHCRIASLPGIAVRAMVVTPAAKVPLLTAPSQAYAAVSYDREDVHQRPVRKPDAVARAAGAAVGAAAVACAVVRPLGPRTAAHRLRADRRDRRAGRGRRDDPQGADVDAGRDRRLDGARASCWSSEAVGLMRQEVPAEQFLADLDLAIAAGAPRADRGEGRGRRSAGAARPPAAAPTARDEDAPRAGAGLRR